VDVKDDEMDLGYASGRFQFCPSYAPSPRPRDKSGRSPRTGAKSCPPPRTARRNALKGDEEYGLKPDRDGVYDTQSGLKPLTDAEFNKIIGEVGTQAGKKNIQA
jgi:hypothetical protein